MLLLYCCNYSKKDKVLGKWRNQTGIQLKVRQDNRGHQERCPEWDKLHISFCSLEMGHLPTLARSSWGVGWCSRHLATPTQWGRNTFWGEERGRLFLSAAVFISSSHMGRVEGGELSLLIPQTELGAERDELLIGSLMRHECSQWENSWPGWDEIVEQNYRIVWVGSPRWTPLPWTGTPSFRSGYSKPCLIQLWIFTMTGGFLGNLFQCLSIISWTYKTNLMRPYSFFSPQKYCCRKAVNFNYTLNPLGTYQFPSPPLLCLLG